MAIQYSEQFDAVYDDSTNQWLESACGDSGCEFCSNRPERPLDQPVNPLEETRTNGWHIKADKLKPGESIIVPLNINLSKGE